MRGGVFTPSACCGNDELVYVANCINDNPQKKFKSSNIYGFH